MASAVRARIRVRQASPPVRMARSSSPALDLPRRHVDQRLRAVAARRRTARSPAASSARRSATKSGRIAVAPGQEAHDADAVGAGTPASPASAAARSTASAISAAGSRASSRPSARWVTWPAPMRTGVRAIRWPARPGGTRTLSVRSRPRGQRTLPVASGREHHQAAVADLALDVSASGPSGWRPPPRRSSAGSAPTARAPVPCSGNNVTQGRRTVPPARTGRADGRLHGEGRRLGRPPCAGSRWTHHQPMPMVSRPPTRMALHSKRRRGGVVALLVEQDPLWPVGVVQHRRRPHRPVRARGRAPVPAR